MEKVELEDVEGWIKLRRKEAKPGPRSDDETASKEKCTQLTALRCVRNRDYAVAHRQGEDGTRVFTVSSILGLAEAEQCQAGPRHLSLSPCSILHKCSAGYQRLSRGLSQYRKAANASRTTDRPQTKYAG